MLGERDLLLFRKEVDHAHEQLASQRLGLLRGGGDQVERLGHVLEWVCLDLEPQVQTRRAPSSTKVLRHRCASATESFAATFAW